MRSSFCTSAFSALSSRLISSLVDKVPFHGGGLALPVRRAALEVFPDSRIKRELIDIVDFCVERAY